MCMYMGMHAASALHSRLTKEFWCYTGFALLGGRSFDQASCGSSLPLRVSPVSHESQHSVEGKALLLDIFRTDAAWISLTGVTSLTHVVSDKQAGTRNRVGRAGRDIVHCSRNLRTHVYDRPQRCARFTCAWGVKAREGLALISSGQLRKSPVAVDCGGRLKGVNGSHGEAIGLSPNQRLHPRSRIELGPMVTARCEEAGAFGSQSALRALTGVQTSRRVRLRALACGIAAGTSKRCM